MSFTDRPVCLLVEDEPLLLRMMKANLEDAGFTVLAAADGLAAMCLIVECRICPSALVTDIRMPGLDGWELARKVRGMFPHVPVVYISGDSAGRVGVEGVPRGRMLQKPFPSARLVEAITELLDDDGPSSIVESVSFKEVCIGESATAQRHSLAASFGRHVSDEARAA